MSKSHPRWRMAKRVLTVLFFIAVIVLLVAMSSVNGAKRKKRMAQAIDTIELSPDVRDSFGKRRRRAQNAGSAKPEKGEKKPEENRAEAQIVPTPEFKPDEQPSSTPARDALRRAEGDENRRRFYFGNVEPFRMAANHEFQHKFSVKKEFLPIDTCDNQLGEMECEERGFAEDELEITKEMISYEAL